MVSILPRRARSSIGTKRGSRMRISTHPGGELRAPRAANSRWHGPGREDDRSMPAHHPMAARRMDAIKASHEGAIA
jgi:hypothetical protein